MSATCLQKGGNIPLPTGLNKLYVALGWSPYQPTGMEVDASAFVLAANGKVREDQDLVFYNNPRIHEGSVEALSDASLAGGDDVQLFALDLPEIPAAIDKIAFTVTIHEGQIREQNFGMLESAWARVVDPTDGCEMARFQLPLAGTPETAMIFCEVYRRQAQWKFKAVGQGYVGGLEPLAIAYGIDVADEAEPAELTPPAPSTPPPHPEPVFVSEPVPPPLEPPLPLPEVAPPVVSDVAQSDVAKRIAEWRNKDPDLAALMQESGLALGQQGLSEHSAKMAICLDISGSMHKLYDKGAMAELVQRVLALDLLLDEDGEVEIFLFGADAYHFGAVNATNYQTFVADMLARHRLESGTHYGKAMNLVRQHYKDSVTELPVYVLFVTDGDTSDRKESERQIVEASREGIFWQFMAIGEDSRAGFFAKMLGPKFEFLSHLDTMRNRLVDNAHFFLVPDPAALTVEELYRQMLAEYPLWLKAAKAKAVWRWVMVGVSGI